ncbi:hypothetical protein bthur0004_11690 [Bacillus thuringiensis serovar sotto str. T04001]|nr:hypothetical protein bthur0004_11690 [Bacillus thuringiensis serovar sotto str. T04001]
MSIDYIYTYLIMFGNIVIVEWIKNIFYVVDIIRVYIA